MTDSKELNYEEAIDKIMKIADALDKDKSELTDEMAEIVTALTKKHKDDASDDSWDDFVEMLDNIKKHASNGNTIVEEDRPHQLRLAFRCTNTNKTWSIKISDVNKSIVKLETKQDNQDQIIKDIIVASALRTFIMTQAGKQTLLNIINGK